MDDAEEYLSQIEVKIQSKILMSVQKTEIGIKGDWFVKLKSSEGIFEFRESDHTFFYRIPAFWDTTGKDKTLILATHGFNKKTNKTPPSEIKRAEKIKKNYFKNKKSK